MQKIKLVLTGLIIPFLFYSCKKDPSPSNLAAICLIKITTNGQDSVDSYSAASLSFQFFSYDARGNVASMRDSGDGWRGWYIGTRPYQLYTQLLNTPLIFQYNSLGNLVKYKRDSFVYDNQNQMIIRLGKILSDASNYSVINKFTYDTKGRLIADSGYFKQSFTNPDGFYTDIICSLMIHGII